MDYSDLAKLISSGGAVALSLVIWYEMRTLKIAVIDAGKNIARILERDRVREEKALAAERAAEIKDFIREEISGVHEAASSEDVTPVEKPERLSRRTPVGGYAIIKPRKE